MKALALLAVLAVIPLSMTCAFEVKDVSGATSIQTLRWNETAGPIKITLNTKGSDDLPIAAVETALKKALDVWQQVPGQTARFEYVGKSSSAVPNTDDGINSIVWIENGWPYSPSVSAITRYSYWLSDPPVFSDADILLNGQSYKWSVDQTLSEGYVNLQQVLTHELGHLLGLAHTGVYNAVMYPSLASTVILFLSPDDKAGLQYLYGSPVNDLRLVNPLMGATYVVGLESHGVPLPVFRWGRGANASFVLEFSDTSSFQKKVSYSTGANSTFGLSGAQEKQIMGLSPSRTIYWRVTAGATKTTPRILHLRKLTEMGNGALATIKPDFDHATFSPVVTAFLPIVLISLMVASFFLYQYLNRRPRKG